MNIQERLLSLCKSRALGPLAYLALKLLGIEFPRSVRAGHGIQLPHGAVGLVVHPATIIGEGVRLHQGVTIGRSDTYKTPDRTRSGGCVVIDSGVVVGAGAKVLFRSGETLTLGLNSVIGANAVVTESVPPGEIWAGSPARKVSFNE